MPHDAYSTHYGKHSRYEKDDGENIDSHMDNDIAKDNLGENMLDGHDHMIEDFASMKFLNILNKSHGSMHQVNCALMVRIKEGRRLVHIEKCIRHLCEMRIMLLFD